MAKMWTISALWSAIADLVASTAYMSQCWKIQEPAWYISISNWCLKWPGRHPYTSWQKVTLIRLQESRPQQVKLTCLKFSFSFFFETNIGRQIFINLNVIFVTIDFHPGRLVRTTQRECMGKRKVFSSPRGWWILRWVETWPIKNML